MKSQTSQVARSCRIREWAAMVQECRNRPNGMSVDEWCRANNITKANYYYRKSSNMSTGKQKSPHFSGDRADFIEIDVHIEKSRLFVSARTFLLDSG